MVRMGARNRHPTVVVNRNPHADHNAYLGRDRDRNPDTGYDANADSNAGGSTPTATACPRCAGV